MIIEKNYEVFILYIYIFFGLFILGFLIQFIKYRSVLRDKEKLTKIHQLSMKFYFSIINNTVEVEDFKSELDDLNFEYKKLLKTKFFIYSYGKTYEVFQLLLTHYQLLLSIVKIRGKDVLLDTLYSKLNTSFRYNNSYYDDLIKEEFKILVNPLLYIGFSLNFIISSIAKSANLKLPKSFESIISVFSGLLSIVQGLFFLYEHFG